MKNIPLKLFAALLLFAICSCNKNTDCHTSYTVSGTLLDGKTGRPITDSGTYLYLNGGPINNNNGSNFNLLTYPDKNGKFSMTYYSCDNDIQELNFGIIVPYKSYYLFNPYDSLGYLLPIQQNINRTWTAATNGWLVLRLQPLSPLLDGDTLLVQLSFVYNDSTKNYFFLTTQTGVLDSLYLPVGDYFINWGRGEKNINNHAFEGDVIGDPNISRYTIKY